MKIRIENNNADILSIDRKIKQHFLSQTEELPNLRKRLKELQQTAANRSLKAIIKKEVNRNIEILQQQIQHLENNDTYRFYVLETAALLQKYEELLKTPIQTSFMGRSTNNSQNSEKIEIVKKYVAKAQKYFPISVEIKTKKGRIKCTNCDNSREFIYTDSAAICEKCFAQQEILSQYSSYKDINRVNISTKYTYDPRIHFRDCINQYQGKQNCRIDDVVYEDLENDMESCGLLNGTRNTTKEVRFAEITLGHVLEFLKRSGHSKHYENCILIHYNLTGIKPDDISHLEDKLMHDFVRLYETYVKVYQGKINRSNFMPAQLILFQLLCRHGHPCRRENFAMIKTIERKQEHDDIIQNLFSRLGWNYTPIF